MDVSKNRGKTPKMDGLKIMEHPMNKWMIWGFPIFLETPIYLDLLDMYIFFCLLVVFFGEKAQILHTWKIQVLYIYMYIYILNQTRKLGDRRRSDTVDPSLNHKPFPVVAEGFFVGIPVAKKCKEAGGGSYLDVPDRKLGSMVRISGLFHLPINGLFWLGLQATYQPSTNFLGHPSTGKGGQSNTYTP